MQLDSSIPLQAKGITIRPMGASLADAFQLRGYQQQNELNAQNLAKGEAEAEAAKRALAEEQALRGIFGSGQPIKETDIFAVVGPTRGGAILKGLADLRTAEAKSEGELKGVVGSALGAIKALPDGLRPDAYKTARESFIAKGWIKPEEVPGAYTPELLDQFQQWAMTPEKQLEAADRVADNRRLDADQADKRPGVLADNVKKGTEALDAQLVTEGRLLGAATNNAQWQAALAQLPEDRRKKHPPLFSAQHAKQVAKVALTAEERLVAAQRDRANAIDAARVAEQARHNRVTESQQSLEAIQGPDGQPILVPRSQAVGKPPAMSMRATEDERKMAGFYSQMRDAITTLDEIEGKLTEKELYQIQTMPQEGLVGMANRGQLSETAKRYLRAFEQFTESRLRPVSGAAISDAEYARDRRTYAKQYSETPKLNEDRRRARDTALGALRTRAGVLVPKDAPKAKDEDPLGIRK